jgi:hypothetical protein
VSMLDGFGDKPLCCSISDRRLDGFEVKKLAGLSFGILKSWQ